jgi:G3E family GTPase
MDDALPPTHEEPEAIAPWDGRRVPVTLLGGYLGSGKTTVLNQVLARTDRPIAVLVNDVGEVNIDAALVRKRHGDTIELTDGCVCCSLAGGLAAAFDGLRQRPDPPDHVIVELSGVADPGRVAPWAGSDGFRLDGVVVLVDADQFSDRVDDPATTEALITQVRRADLLVLTKLDLVGTEAASSTRTRLHSLAPDVPVVDAPDAVATAALLDLATRRPGGVTDVPSPGLFDLHDVRIETLPCPITEADLNELLAALPPSTLRAKGIAQAPDGTRLLAQVVGRRAEVTVLPGAERQPPTDLVVITTR